MIKWDESFSVGIKTFDAHHMKLFAVLNALEESSKESEEISKSMDKTLNELQDYTNYHFSEEEKALEEHGYSGLDRQKEEHNDFIATVKVFRASFEYGVVPPAEDILTFLGKWLKNHIKKTDRDYTDFLIQKGFY